MDELTHAAAQLTHAVERARIGEDRELAAVVRERGEQLAGLLYGLLRTTRLYSADNAAFDQPIAELRNALEGLVQRLGSVHLVTVEDQVYVNDVRVRFGERTGTPAALGQELKRHNVGGISFLATPSEERVRKLIACFARPPAATSPRAALAEALVEAGVGEIELAGVYRFAKVGEKTDAEDGDAQTPDVLERAEGLVDAALASAFSARVLNVLSLRRVVSEMIRSGADASSETPETTTVPPHVGHSLRVCLGALTIGRALELDEGTLQDLGVAALLHDVGYAAPTDLAAEAVVQLPHHVGHTVAGARLVARQKGFHEGKVRRVLSLLHHHRDAADPRGRPVLFARILRIADDYDNLVRAGGLTPPEAMVGMATGAGTRYDRALLQIFVNRLGRYPPGTLIALRDGRVVRTTSLVRSPETFDRPMARITCLADGATAEGEPPIDLAVEGEPARLLRRLA